METPVSRSRHRGTPASGRLRSAAKTPKSVLTPNDDAAECANNRRKRQSKALRLSLSDAFAGHADQHRTQQQQQLQDDPSTAKPMLSEEARTALLEQCLKLATENKISDRNAWHLDLITHLPDIVGSGAHRGAHLASSSSAGSGFNFQKMSGGLDAGVTIYSKRVDLTYRDALSLGSAPSKQQQGGAGEDGYEDEDGGDGEADTDLGDAAAAATAKAQRQAKGGAKGRQGASAVEEATLAAPEQLQAKAGDTTFAVDPLFHTMSALFDEGGAKGLLLLNRSVYDGAHIMTRPQDIPEQAFPLPHQHNHQQQQQQQDVLLDLRALQQQLAACSSGSSSNSGSQGRQGLALTPALDQLYQLLQQTCRTLPATHRQQHQQQQEDEGRAGGACDVSAIMQQALRNLPPTPMPRRSSSNVVQTTAAAGAAADADGDVDMADADSFADTAADAAADVDADASRGDSSGSAGGAAAAAAEGPGVGGLPVVASFLATCEAEAAAEEAYAAAAAAAGDDGCDSYGEGYEDEGEGGWSQQQQQQQQVDRRQSLLGLGGGQVLPGDEEGSSSGLDEEALQQLLGAAAGGAGGGGSSSSSRGGTTAGSGWAGSRFWKYRSAAAAAARMAAGSSSSSGGAVRRAAAAATAGKGRSAAAGSRLDFSCRPDPAELAARLAPGDRRQTCLVNTNSSSSSGTADTLLPEDLNYQASSLLQLFLRPSPISLTRQQQQQQGRYGSGAGGQPLPSRAEEGAAGGGGGEGEWGGQDGYCDDEGGDDGGAEGYNAGDLSVGDPGFSAAAAAPESAGRSEWWSAEGELLSAPSRMAGRGVNYQRSAKQVDVRALKDLLWDSLVTANQQAARTTTITTTTSSSSREGLQDTAGLDTPSSTTRESDAAAAAAGAVVPFQSVIGGVPGASAAGPLADVSVHMCFICLLHLANERGLVVRAGEDLSTLNISNVTQPAEQRQQGEGGCS